MNALTEVDDGRFSLSNKGFHLTLLAGGALLFLSMYRFSAQELAWVAFAPFLVAMTARSDFKGHLWLLFYLTIAMNLTVAKIISPPVILPVPLFAVPAAVYVFAGISLTAAISRRLGVRWGIYFFPAITVAAEWLNYSFTELGTWGALALTQVDNLPLAQSGSLAGIAGLSFLVALGSSVTAAVAIYGPRAVKGDIFAFIILFIATQAYGNLRLLTDPPLKNATVAAVSSPLPLDLILEMRKSTDIFRPYDSVLFDRTGKAADMGAKTVVWNEAGTLLRKDEEEAFVARGAALAREKGISLVMAIGVVNSFEPFVWENKYHFITSSGKVADVYHKRHPVPGEGPIPGEAKAAVVEVDGVKMTGAICYDYDFPQIARDNAQSGADMVLLPSSDWPGIDPVHSMMARYMALSNGMPMVRSVRRATSFASDQYGRTAASMRFDGDADGIMIADVPVGRVPTLYADTGDVLPVMALIFCAVSGLAALIIPKVRRRLQPEEFSRI
ncbi:MAG: hypothetical protein HZB29_03800 [Nitrospinae bacterium]|nr:hypothetical protein [Nitrospinota bacterium]